MGGGSPFLIHEICCALGERNSVQSTMQYPGRKVNRTHTSTNLHHYFTTQHNNQIVIYTILSALSGPEYAAILFIKTILTVILIF